MVALFKLKIISKSLLFALRIKANSHGSRGITNEIWNSIDIHAKSADHIANKLEIPGFTGDLLFKYVLAYLQPTLENNGDRPLKHLIDGLKAKGVIPIKPQQHLWYDAWSYSLKNRGGNWNMIKNRKGKWIVC